jgi:hypothetical protein
MVKGSLHGHANLCIHKQLLANLWACGAVLQYCFSQESVDYLIPLYISSVNPESEFDPSQLSIVVGQVKYKVAEDKRARPTIHPIGAPHNHHQPLPYLAILTMTVAHK